MTAFFLLDRGHRVFSRHRGITATEKAAASHPDRHGDR